MTDFQTWKVVVSNISISPKPRNGEEPGVSSSVLTTTVYIGAHDQQEAVSLAMKYIDEWSLLEQHSSAHVTAEPSTWSDER